MPAAKDLGTKHACFKCGTKFYDLKKPAPICPKCGADQRDQPPPPKPTHERAAKKAPVREIEPEELPEEEEELEAELEEGEEEGLESDEDEVD